MARQNKNDPRQTSFLESLDQQLDQRKGELVPLEITIDDIGGALIAVLSKGLYTNPLDCIREYVQNAVDAEAKSVIIKITGNSVIIFDEGNGMNLDELVQARQFGLSVKSLTDYVGFRGIGIYSGFDLCQRLRITTTKEGDPELHVLVFEFAEMKAELEKDKNRAPNEAKTSLVKLLSKYTYIKRERSEVPLDRHFTQVELQNISDVYIRQLSNRAELKKYLLQNLPLDFADEFEYRDILNKKLLENVQGYRAIKVILQSDGLKDEVVVKDLSPTLQEPDFGFIETSAGQRLAYYWACLNSERGRLQRLNRDDISTEAPEYEGFVYKVKGFTIGDRQKLRAMFLKKPQLYNWYTGEIYIIDENIIPNTERDDFETNPAKRALELAVGKELSSLEEKVENFQAQGVASERIEKYQEEMLKIESQVATNTQESDFETYSRLNDILRDLRRQKSKAGQQKRVLADDLVKRAERLQRQLSREVDNPTPESKRRKRAAVRDEKQTAMPIVESPLPVPPKTLPNILKDAGWELEGDIELIINLIQESLEDVLRIGSPSYRYLLNNVEARLTSTIADE